MAVEDEDEDREDERARGRPAQSNSQSSAPVESDVRSIADDASNAEVGWMSRNDEAVGNEEVVDEVEERREGRAQRRTCG